MRKEEEDNLKRLLRYREYMEGCETCQFYEKGTNQSFCKIVENLFGLIPIKASGNCDRFKSKTND